MQGNEVGGCTLEFNEKLQELRKNKGLTQEELAEALYVSRTAISKWESGKSMPDSGIMLELCELLKINVNELLSGERIMAEAYDKRAEENLLAMRREVEEKNRQIYLNLVMACMDMQKIANFMMNYQERNYFMI